MKKKYFKYLLLLTFLALVYGVYSNYPRLNIIAGYSAKNMSSSVFLADRDAVFTDKNDHNFSPINLATDKVNNRDFTNTASVYGILTRKAIYREGLGSVLITEDFDESSTYLKPKRHQIKINLPFPYGNLEPEDSLFSTIDYSKLDKVVSHAFEANDLKKTRAVLVVYKDKIIAEKYAKGFDKNSKILGWSMTKSLTSTIFGILQSQGKLEINDKAPVASWQNDKRQKITLNDLLHMNSGLAWNEDYNTISDVTKMLFLEKDMSKIQERKELVGKPNQTWNYSSGTSNLLSGLLRGYFKSHQEYLDFWYTSLIDKIGMYSMTIEADLTGNYVGSSYGWATPRDWAKFGLLYLHKGQWNGTQIFDASWVDYVTQPTNMSDGDYGGHFWLNAGSYYPDAPTDMYSANGYQGQRIFIIPSKEMVIIRMGLSGDEHFNFNQFLKEVTGAIN